MKSKTASDLMTPLDKYPVVDISATVIDAVLKLEKSRRNMEPGRQPFQAILVADGEGRIVGKLGQLTLLKALLPGHRNLVDRDTLEKAGVSDTIIETALDHLRAFQHEFSEMCARDSALPVREVMHPIREHIDISASMGEVIHSMVVWQTLSLLVNESGRPVGLVRLSDITDAVIAEMVRSTSSTPSED